MCATSRTVSHSDENPVAGLQALGVPHWLSRVCGGSARRLPLDSELDDFVPDNQVLAEILWLGDDRRDLLSDELHRGCVLDQLRPFGAPRIRLSSPPACTRSAPGEARSVARVAPVPRGPCQRNSELTAAPAIFGDAEPGRPTRCAPSRRRAADARAGKPSSAASHVSDRSPGRREALARQRAHVAGPMDRKRRRRRHRTRPGQQRTGTSSARDTDWGAAPSRRTATTGCFGNTGWFRRCRRVAA